MEEVSSSDSTLRLYLVRDGETEWSLSGQHTGCTNIPLTVHREHEARQLRPVLEHIPFAAVLTSSRQRVRGTCELAGLGRSATTEPDLGEWDYGDYEGQRTVDIDKGRPSWNVFRDGRPHGEMPGDVSARADRLLASLCDVDGNVALFTHGQFGCVLAARWIGFSVIDAQHLSLGAASLSILGVNPSHGGVRIIALWNAAPELFTRPCSSRASFMRETTL
jgi:broad specificity phosphatase PhoE